MEKIIEEILSDLYALDKDLIQYDKALRKAIEKIIESKPDTKFDENFKLRLRGELLAKAQQLKNSAEEKSLKNKASVLLESFSVALGQFSQSRWVLALPMLILVIGVAFFVQRQYGQNGGVYLTKQNVSFALAPANLDLAGIEPDTSFVLKSSKDLSKVTIKKTLSFKPAVDFSVTKVKKTAMLALPALADEQANAQELPYQYEIKPTGELEKGKVYQVAIKNEQIADRDYQWAFQVKAPFGVVETFPTKKDTGVALNTGIEIQFNRNLSEGAEKYFEILPKTEGNFETKMDKLYFHPKELAEKQIYTITLKKGLTSKDDNEVLNEDYVFAFETKSKDDGGADKNKIEELNNGITEVAPDMQPRIGWSQPGETKTEKFKLKLYMLDGSRGFLESYRASENWGLYWSSENRKKGLDLFLPAENQKMLSAEIKYMDGFFEIPQQLKEGYYFFEIDGKKTRDYGWITVSKNPHYYSLTGNTGLLWAYDFLAKKPLQETEISFVDQNNNEKGLGKLDSEGLLKFVLPEELKNNSNDKENYGPQFFKIYVAGSEPVVFPINEGGYSKIDTGKRYWEALSTDKYLYKQNDTVNYWGVLKGKERDLNGEKLSVNLYGDTSCYEAWKWDESINVATVASKDVAISKFDTVTGNFKLENLPVGQYCLRVINKEKKESYSGVNFQVESYQKPTYQITVNASKKAVFAGEELSLKVQASFYDGSPVSNLKLTYNDNFANAEGGLNGELILDKNGAGELNYKAKFFNDYNVYGFAVSELHAITFQPELAEEGDIWGSVGVEVFGSTLNLDSQITQQEAGKFEVTAKLKKIDLSKYSDESLSYLSDPVADHEIKAELIKITQIAKEDGQYYDYITKTEQKSYTYSQKEETVEKFSSKSDQQGEWKFERKIENVDPAVSYKIVLNTVDGQKRKVSSEVYLNSVFSGNDGYLELSSNKDAFFVGDKVKLNLKTEETDKSLNNKTLFYRYQSDIEDATVKDGSFFEEEFSANFAPLENYRAVILTPYGFEESNAVTVQTNLKDKALSVEIKPFKGQYLPGEQAQVQIIVKDKKGNPVATQINVAVVDEALFQNGGTNSDVLADLYHPFYTYPIVGYTQYANRLIGGGRGGGGEPRNVFLDVPYFQNLETDANGSAVAEFKLPDNLTGWRITAKAFDTKTMNAGQAHEVISTGLPFFVDATLNETYLTGDMPELKLRFFGRDYDSSQPVEYSVTAKEANLNQIGSAKSSAEYLSLGALAKGEYEIKISAKQGNKSDALIKKIVVKDSYFTKQTSQTYLVSNNLKNLQGNEEGFTRLVFTDKGKGKFFGTLSENANDSGTRLDQFVSNFIANKLLAENYYQRKFEKDFDVSSFLKNDENDNSNGQGLNLFASLGEANLELSAKVADAVPNAVNQDALKTYFNSSLYDSKADIHRISKALYGLASLGEPVLSRVNSVKAYQSELALDDKIYLGLALAKSGDLEGARAYYEAEIKSSLKIEGEQAWLEANNIPVEPEKLTATLGMLTSTIGEQMATEKIWNYVATHNPQRDLSILEKVILIKNQLAKMPTQQASFKMKTNLRSENISLGNERTVSVTLSREEMNTLSFSEVRGEVEVMSVFESGEKQNLQNDANLKLTRAYKLGEMPSAEFMEGDVVKVSLTAQFLPKATDSIYQIKDLLPSGLKPTSPEMDAYSGRIYNQSDSADWCNATWYPEKIDGQQIYFSFDRQSDIIEHKCANFTINYYARVISKGSFKADSATLQSIENLQKYFVTPASQIEIK